MAISETVNVLSVGWRMCKQAGTIERTGVFFVFFFFSCLVIKPSQTFALLLTHTDSQTLFPQKPTNIAPTPTGCNAPLRELCALKWCVKWVYVFVPVCACAFVLVCVCVCACVYNRRCIQIWSAPFPKIACSERSVGCFMPINWNAGIVLKILSCASWLGTCLLKSSLNSLWQSLCLSGKRVSEQDAV